MALTLRPIGKRDYQVREVGQNIGRIRYADERIPGVWIWNVQVHIPTVLPMGSAKDLNTAKDEFKAAWEGFKSRHTAEQFERAYSSMNIRKDG